MSLLVAEDLWKTYPRAPTRDVKGIFIGRDRIPDEAGPRWAVQGVSLAVGPGECQVVIGRNGAGKTTLLSMLLGAFQPDRGKILRNGRVSALIDLGGGFHRELTGRENVMLFGSTLGMRLAEVRRRMPGIEEFAELGAAFDEPIRTWSSGMVARLGFSTAIQVDADVLLVDEVLAVGDLSFHDRCMVKIREFLARGGAMVMATHDMTNSRALGTRALRLEQGRVVDAGHPDEVIPRYQEAMRLHRTQRLASHDVPGSTPPAERLAS